MQSARIYFSDSSSIEVKEYDTITPVTFIEEKEHAAPVNDFEINSHTSAGVIPSLMDYLLRYDFFYLNNNRNVLYGTHTITRIELS